MRRPQGSGSTARAPAPVPSPLTTGGFSGWVFTQGGVPAGPVHLSSPSCGPPWLRPRLTRGLEDCAGGLDARAACPQLSPPRGSARPGGWSGSLRAVCGPGASPARTLTELTLVIVVSLQMFSVLNSDDASAPALDTQPQGDEEGEPRGSGGGLLTPAR